MKYCLIFLIQHSLNKKKRGSAWSATRPGQTPKPWSTISTAIPLASPSPVHSAHKSFLLNSFWIYMSTLTMMTAVPIVARNVTKPSLKGTTLVSTCVYMQVHAPSRVLTVHVDSGRRSRYSLIVTLIGTMSSCSQNRSSVQSVVKALR